MQDRQAPSMEDVEKRDWQLPLPRVPINPAAEETPLSIQEQKWALWRVSSDEPMSFESSKATS